MKIVLTADLHYNVHRSRQPALAAAQEICDLQADALILLGDAAGRDLSILQEGLHLFDRFAGRKFFVAGNHDLWTEPGDCSLQRLEHILPAVCRQAGFHPLDAEPAIIEGVGLVGCIGWYDYSFRPFHLDIPLRFYQAKTAPGAAARIDGCEHLFRDTADIPETAMRIGTRWMDAVHIRLPMSDVEFAHHLLERLTGHLDWAAQRCDRMVIGLHHVPFWEMVPRSPKPNWAFASAFLGSELFGELLLAQPKVCYALCGHTHRYLRMQHHHIECIDIGSTYLAKRYEVLEL